MYDIRLILYNGTTVTIEKVCAILDMEQKTLATEDRLRKYVFPMGQKLIFASRDEKDRYAGLYSFVDMNAVAVIQLII